MTNTPSASPEIPRDYILGDGFFASQDATIGQQIEEMDTMGTPFASAAGLRSCEVNVVKNPRIRPILDSLFAKPFALGLYRSFGISHGDSVFMKKTNDESRTIVVQLWRKGSTAVFWPHSHQHILSYVRGENNLWRVPRVVLTRLGLKPTEIRFEQGGFTVLDPHVAFEITMGRATTFAFGTEETVCLWDPMNIPRSQDIMAAVSSMEDDRFKMNVAYFEPKQEI